MHPLVVHFAIALLLIAPFFVAVGLFLPRTKAKHTILAGFALVAIGTRFLFLTTETGDAAADHVHKSPTASSLLHGHEELAETTEIAFGTLLALFAALSFGPTLLKKELTIRMFRNLRHSDLRRISKLSCVHTVCLDPTPLPYYAVRTRSNQRKWRRPCSKAKAMNPVCSHTEFTSNKRSTELCPFLQEGQRIRVARGPLAGLEGILVQKKSQWRVVISVEMLKLSLSVEIDHDCVSAL